jgi:hypothetical protein
MNLEKFIYSSSRDLTSNLFRLSGNNERTQRKIFLDILRLKNINDNYNPRFRNFQRLTNYVKKTYNPHVQLTLLEDYPIRGIVVLSHIFVSEQYRGNNFGKNIISLINQTADETQQIIVLEPALNEDGRIKFTGLTNSEKQAAKLYQERLIDFYFGLGYSLLQDYESLIIKDFYSSLRFGGTMVRFPNNIIPENIKK